MAKTRKNCLVCARSVVSLGEIWCPEKRRPVDQHEAVECKRYKRDRTAVGTWRDVIPQTVTVRNRRGSVTVKL